MIVPHWTLLFIRNVSYILYDSFQVSFPYFFRADKFLPVCLAQLNIF